MPLTYAPDIDKLMRKLSESEEKRKVLPKPEFSEELEFHDPRFRFSTVPPFRAGWGGESPRSMGGELSWRQGSELPAEDRSFALYDYLSNLHPALKGAGLGLKGLKFAAAPVLGLLKLTRKAAKTGQRTPGMLDSLLGKKQRLSTPLTDKEASEAIIKGSFDSGFIREGGEFVVARGPGSKIDGVGKSVGDHYAAAGDVISQAMRKGHLERPKNIQWRSGGGMDAQGVIRPTLHELMKQGGVIRTVLYRYGKGATIVFQIGKPATQKQLVSVRRMIKDARPLESIRAERGVGLGAEVPSQSFSVDLGGQDQLSGFELNRLMKFLSGE